LTLWSSTQNAHATRDGFATVFGLENDQVRVIAPDIGGGFGAKSGSYPEDTVAAVVARKLARPIRWAETRSEGMLGLVHGRAQDYVATIGGTKDGRVLAYKLHVTQDGGAYPEIGSVLPFMTSIVASGSYDIAAVQFSANSVMTNTVPIGAYRGAGRPEAAAAIERMMDLFAVEVGISPIEVRKLNFHAPDSFPLTTPTGANMDTGEYAAALDLALQQADYEQLKIDQAARLADPEAKLLGIGISSYIEIANPMGQGEYGSIEVMPDGSAVVLTGSSAHGQGHHTAFAQVASEVTGIPFEKIEVRHGDTSEVPRGGGTGGSKSLQVGGSAVWEASEAAVDQAKEVAAKLLEANPADIVHDADAGSFAVAGTPALSIGWGDVTQSVKDDTGSNLRAETDFNPPGATFPFGAHVAVVEVDRDTGQVSLVRHICCDDAGTMINPMLVEGQVHGGVASGAAQALMEEFSYDEIGNPLTMNFMDYPLVSAAELPSFERVAMETPTPRNPLGAKGIGESGTIGATPAVQNAVVDALSHLGVRHVDIPTTPERVWNAMGISRM
jgi:carbon-monoxide dehydrogenase large subunit